MLPKEVVDHLGVQVGDVVIFTLGAKGRVTVRPMEEPRE
mgnify:FL=1